MADLVVISELKLGLNPSLKSIPPPWSPSLEAQKQLINKLIS